MAEGTATKVGRTGHGTGGDGVVVDRTREKDEVGHVIEGEETEAAHAIGKTEVEVGLVRGGIEATAVAVHAIGGTEVGVGHTRGKTEAVVDQETERDEVGAGHVTGRGVIGAGLTRGRTKAGVGLGRD